MKVEVRRFSPHQNAKVFAVMMALLSLVAVVPMFLVYFFAPMPEGEGGPMAIMLLLFPFAYLVMGYIMVLLGCAFYNLVCKYTGGIEYEINSREA